MAVLVVATPCPLILAMPIAIVSGLSRTARCGVVVRDGGSLEILGRAKSLLVDKTGTLTVGQPRVVETVTPPDVEPDEVLRLAASVEQLSGHVLAAAVVREAQRRGLLLTMPADVSEEPGSGVSDRVEDDSSGSASSPARRRADGMGRRAALNRALLDTAASPGSASTGDRPARIAVETRCAATRRARYADCAPRGSPDW